MNELLQQKNFLLIKPEISPCIYKIFIFEGTGLENKSDLLLSIIFLLSTVTMFMYLMACTIRSRSFISTEEETKPLKSIEINTDKIKL